MRWQVQVNEPSGDVLAETLAAAGFTLDGNRLMGDAFEALDDPQAVSALAHDLAHKVREIGRLKPDIEIGFWAGPVFEFDENGDEISEHAIVRIAGAASIAIGEQVVAVLTDASLSPEERAEIERQARADKASEMLRAMMASERVHTVMTLLDGEPRPFDMWKAWELMRDDVSVDPDDLHRFRRATNDPRIAGEDARHALPGGDLPDNPMSVTDATTFIRQIADQWIAEKGA